jgi:hypothetical protein
MGKPHQSHNTISNNNNNNNNKNNDNTFVNVENSACTSSPSATSTATTTMLPSHSRVLDNDLTTTIDSRLFALLGVRHVCDARRCAASVARHRNGDRICVDFCLTRCNSTLLLPPLLLLDAASSPPDAEPECVTLIERWSFDAVPAASADSVDLSRQLLSLASVLPLHAVVADRDAPPLRLRSVATALVDDKRLTETAQVGDVTVQFAPTLPLEYRSNVPASLQICVVVRQLVGGEWLPLFLTDVDEIVAAPAPAVLAPPTAANAARSSAVHALLRRSSLSDDESDSHLIRQLTRSCGGDDDDEDDEDDNADDAHDHDDNNADDSIPAHDAMFVTDLEHEDATSNGVSPLSQSMPSSAHTTPRARVMPSSISQPPTPSVPSNVPLLSRRIARPGTPDPHHQSPRFRSMSKLRVTLPPEASQSMVVMEEEETTVARSPRPNGKLAGSMRPPTALSPFIGSFEASLLAGRMSNAQTNVFHGFSAQLVVSGRELFGEHMRLDFDASYCVVDAESDVALPYVSDIELPKSGYEVPPKGIVQLTLFNPSRTPIKTFLVSYDVSDMPPHTKTFMRQRIFVAGGTEAQHDVLKYAVHLKLCSPRRKRYFLYKYVRVVFPFRQPDPSEQLVVRFDMPQDPTYFAVSSKPTAATATSPTAPAAPAIVATQQ